MDALYNMDELKAREEGQKETFPPTTFSQPSSLCPSHYAGAGTSSDIIGLCLSSSLGFCEGNIIKYVARWKQKGGLEDLRKAKTYLDRLIAFQTQK